jgi:hypothetical protein
MRTATSNLVIVTSETTEKSITGLAMDSNNNINIKFAIANNDVNRAIFVPEANLVVSGNFRIAREVCTIGIWIQSIIAVVSLPTPELELIPTPAPEVIDISTPPTPAQKATATKKAKAQAKAKALATV